MSPVDSEELLYNVFRFAFAGGLLLFLGLMVRVMLREIDLVTRDTIDRPPRGTSTGWLMVIDGGASQMPINQSLLIEGRATVGRGEECDIVFDDPSVSTVHAAVYFVTDHWVVEDYESMNGTYASGKPVLTPTALSDGDVLQFGRVRVRMLC